jgi:hypothetical protein
MFKNENAWLTQVNVVNNVINNADIQKSYEYYHMFKQQYSAHYGIINDYRQEVDCGEWVDNPLTVSFKIMNWLLQRKITPQYSYIPEELYCKYISNKQVKEQLQNIEVMNNELQKFPIITASNNPQGINLFRGVSCKFTNFESLRPGSQTTFDSFLSTSLFLDTAIRFTERIDKCIMVIHINPGTALPFITDNLLYRGKDNVTSEAEVVLPIGATLKFAQKINYNGFNIYCFELMGFRTETRQFWSSYNAILESIWSHIEVARLQNKEDDEDEESMDVGGDSIFKKKRRSMVRNGKKVKKSVKVRKSSKVNKSVKVRKSRKVRRSSTRKF